MTQNWELCIEYNCCFHTNMKYAREYNIFSKVFVFYEQTSFMKKYILYFDTVFVKYLFCFIYFPICDYWGFFMLFILYLLIKTFIRITCLLFLQLFSQLQEPIPIIYQSVPLVTEIIRN